ncbi:hypothetical protein F3I16_13295 [Pseudomonas sp. L-22-4S-12]|uniref:hypothetical protein n=1 Tax=Pseudomonas sp. L-22-4S-12 TaxID=2610893 RepID=UPI001320D4D7|nr:hypothetical protein [Pseudomonas sp. L-22-4S-12]MWV17013.1 hypothetical protein [Pseudomonas sp. L-22-4S-12]
MRKTLLLFCLLHPLLASGNALDAQRLNEIDSRSKLLCASAMAYFDPREREPDTRGLTSVYHNLMALDTLVVQLGGSESLHRPLQSMRTVFETLEGLPRKESAQFPPLVRQLLESSDALQQTALATVTSSASDPLAEELGAQSRALASLLLDYQLRGYPLPDPQPFALSSEQVRHFDAEVNQRFKQLQANYPQHAVALGKIDNTYRFVRSQLLQGNGHLSGGANFYLDRAISDLDDLAATISTVLAE